MIEKQYSEKDGKRSPSAYNLFDFAKGQFLHIPDDFSNISGWSVHPNLVVKVHIAVPCLVRVVMYVWYYQ